MTLLEILQKSMETKASDLFIVVGRPITFKINEKLTTITDSPLMPADTLALITEIYGHHPSKEQVAAFEKRDDDFAITLRDLGRFRVNIYRQRNSWAAVIRVIKFGIPNPNDMGVPETIMNLANNTSGMVLVTGATGSGKSTTLACLIDHINKTRNNHIVTVEDPIEFLHSHNKSIISQRELSLDTTGYLQALRASLRQAPDVILIGEMRDHETISTAMSAAETGHLVFSSLHTIGAANTIDRIIDAFDANQQTQIRNQLSMVLQAVVSQQLVPTVDGKLAPAFEIMVVNSAVRNMIRESKIHQLDTVIHSSRAEGMITMDTSLFELYQKGTISKETTLTYSVNEELMKKRISLA